MKVKVEDQSESCGSLRPPLPTQSHAIRLSTRPTLPSVPPEKKSMVFLRIRAYLPWRPSGKSPMKRAYPTNMSLSETCHSHGRKFPCVLIHYRLINGKCLPLPPSDEPWLSSCTESLGNERIGETGGGGNFLQSEYLLFHRDCMPILGINHVTGENTRDERWSTYLRTSHSSVYPLAETSLHSRLNGWIATQLFTVLPVSHSPPYLSRPIHRSMLGWNASIPIPSFMIYGPSRYEIFPVRKHIHAEDSPTSFPSLSYRGRNS